MARGSTYRVPPRRRREGKTDYQARKALVLSRRPRLVARNTSKNIVAQIIVAKPHGDEVLVAAHSRELRKYGWKAPTGNIPAAYLTGLLCGLKAKAKGVDGAILDIGLIAPSKGAKIFATLSGVLDAGVDVPHDEEKVVKARIEGKHIAAYGKSLQEDAEVYSAKFSKYVEQKLPPEKLPEHIAQVKADIISSFGKKPEKKTEQKSEKKSTKKSAKKSEKKSGKKA
jgi:large subunit ribosomal protein L18